MAALFQINDCVYYPGASAFSELEVKTAPVHSSSEEVAAGEILSEAVHTSYFMPKVKVGVLVRTSQSSVQ